MIDFCDVSYRGYFNRIFRNHIFRSSIGIDYSKTNFPVIKDISTDSRSSRFRNGQDLDGGYFNFIFFTSRSFLNFFPNVK